MSEWDEPGKEEANGPPDSLSRTLAVCNHLVAVISEDLRGDLVVDDDGVLGRMRVDASCLDLPAVANSPGTVGRGTQPYVCQHGCVK